MLTSKAAFDSHLWGLVKVVIDIVVAAAVVVVAAAVAVVAVGVVFAAAVKISLNLLLLQLRWRCWWGPLQTAWELLRRFYGPLRVWLTATQTTAGCWEPRAHARVSKFSIYPILSHFWWTY